MMSHCIHSYICFILKPRKIWCSRGSCCRFWGSSGVRHNFPQIHFEKGAGKNNSTENVKNSFSLPVFLFFCDHTEDAGAYGHMQGTTLNESPVHCTALHMWASGSSAPCPGYLWRCPANHPTPPPPPFCSIFHVLSTPELEPRLFRFSAQSPTDQLPPESETTSKRTDHILTVAPSRSLRVSCFLHTPNSSYQHL